VDAAIVTSCYQLLAELLLYPEVRQEDRIRQLGPEVEEAPSSVRKPLQELLANPAIHDCGAYLEELEMSANRPLYLGFYLFDEPESCSSAGTCGRNGYMIELSAIYRHYGLELDGREMPDFLPLVLDFLALSADRREGDEGALRAELIAHYVQPAVIAMHERFSEKGGPWLLALDALKALLRGELEEPRVVVPVAAKPQGAKGAQRPSTECAKELL
jgi:nitrate reductase delta subunit